MTLFNLKNRKNFSRQNIVIVVLISAIVGSLLVIPARASAQVEAVAAGGLALGQYAISGIIQFIHPVSITFATFAAGALNWALNIKIDTNVVRGTWEITRDFANMFFILALIVMAFATIFDLGSFGYGGYDWRASLARLVFVAVMINFSLVIGQIVIDASQTVSSVFLNAIGDAASRIGQGIVEADKLATGENFASMASAIGASIVRGSGLPGSGVTATFLDFASSMARDSLSLGATMQLFFTTIVFFIVAMSMITVVIFAVVRVFMLWFLLIVSPLAWITFVFPKLSRVNQEWWRRFIGWNVFLPIYLFFLYLGLFILNQQQTVMSSIFSPNAPANFWQAASVGVGLSVQGFFFYALVVYIMWAGTALAHKASITAGAGGVAAWGKAKTYAAGRFIGAPVVKRYDATKEAVQMRFGQFQKEGLPGRGRWLFEGSEAQEARKSRYKAALGVRGSEVDYQRKFVDKADRELTTLKENLDKGRLTIPQLLAEARSMKGDSPEGFARAKLAAEKGVLDDALFESKVTEMSSNRYALNNFIETTDKSGYASAGPGNVLSMGIASPGGPHAALRVPAATEARRKMIKKMISNPVALGTYPGGFDDVALDQAMQTFGADSASGIMPIEARELLKDLAKNRPDLTIDYGIAHPMPGIAPMARASQFEALLNTDSVADIAKVGTQVWRDPDFQGAITSRLTIPPGLVGRAATAANRARSQFISNMINNLRTVYDGPAKTAIFHTLI